MGRCLSPCLGDLDPNLYRRRLDEALRLFVGGIDGRERLIAHVEGQMHRAAAEQRFERAGWLRRRARRLRAILDRLGGVLEATHARPRLVLAEHPVAPAVDAFWLVAGRLVDWGELDRGAGPGELEHRTRAALTRAPRAGELATHLSPGEVDEVRIVATYLASHPDTSQLVLEPMPGAAELAEFIDSGTSRAAEELTN
jgi:DNA polymerase-3 subunit epsilon